VLAAQILWAGLRLAFFTGADRVLEGFVYLWENAWKLTKQFVVTMGKLVMSAAASIRDMLISGLTMSASGVKAALASLFNSANTELSLSVAMDGSVDQARGQLNALTSRAQALQRRKQQATNRQPQKRPNANRNQQLQAAEMQRQQRLRMAAYQRQQQALRRQQAQQPPPKRLPQVEIDARRAQQQLKAGIAEADKNACCQGVTPDKSEEVATAAQGGVKKTSKLSSTGTFSAAAATLLGLGTNKAAEQTASNTGKQVRLTQKLLKKKSAGPQFGT
jgi:type II secretory pathway pseudopilin PulG